MKPLCPTLPLSELRFRFTAEDGLHLPPFTGSMWHGALGYALKRAVCVTGLPECGGCLLLHACAFPYLYRTPRPPESEWMRRYPFVPAPMILRPRDATPRALRPGDEVALDVVLVGKANDYLPYLIAALDRAGEKGLGRERSRIWLTAVSRVDQGESTETPVYVPDQALTPVSPATPAAPAVPRGLRFEFQSPLRLAPPLNDGFDFRRFAMCVVRRVAMLQYFHTADHQEADFAALKEEALAARIQDRSLTWSDQQRYSRSHGGRIPLGGLVGDFTVSLPPGSALWPYLFYGQWVHAGKYANMGMGRYRIEALASVPG